MIFEDKIAEAAFASRMTPAQHLHMMRIELDILTILGSEITTWQKFKTITPLVAELRKKRILKDFEYHKKETVAKMMELIPASNK